MFWRGEDHDDCCALAQRVDELPPASLRVRMSAVDLAEMRAGMEASGNGVRQSSGSYGTTRHAWK